MKIEAEDIIDDIDKLKHNFYKRIMLLSPKDGPIRSFFKSLTVFGHLLSDLDKRGRGFAPIFTRLMEHLRDLYESKIFFI